MAAYPKRAFNSELIHDRATALPTLEEIYRDHFDFVFRIATRLGGRELDAEDITQDVFMIVARQLDRYDPKTARMTTWLYGITLNVVRPRRRRRRLELLYRADDSSGVDVALASPDAADVKAAWQIANEILETLAPKKRDVFVLAEFEGLPCSDIAEIVGTREETVWSRLHYARREFSEKLARRRCRSNDPH